MTTTLQTRLPEEYALKYIKYAFALVIITMGAYGYHRFFASHEAGVAVWFVVVLFAVIEVAILTITTLKFSTSIAQEKAVGYGLWFAIMLMWLISAVGIDQTIWSLVESKYHSVALQEKSIVAQKEQENHLKETLAQLYNEKLSLQKEIEQTIVLKQKAQKLYNKKELRLRDIIYYNGRRCDLSTDCTARKEVGQNALDIAKQNLEALSQKLMLLSNKIDRIEAKIVKTSQAIDTIVEKRVAFEAKNRVVLDNKEEEAIMHVKLMEFINSFAGLHITTPERAYVMLLSFAVYPIYILFVAFVASNSQEMQQARAKRLKKAKNSPTFTLIAQLLKKLIYYTIKTRVRKVKKIEIEKEVEVVQEVEKIVYKDGKEIVKVEVPYVVEKEVVVEKVVEKPVVEKEFITIPADIDLNELNKFAKQGTLPKDLSEVLKKYNLDKGVQSGQYRVA